MKTSSQAYMLRPFMGWFSNSNHHWVLRDTTPEDTPPLRQNQMELHALVRSGDYFAELATRIENMAHGDTTPTQEELEAIAAELFYIHDTYRIIKK